MSVVNPYTNDPATEPQIGLVEKLDGDVKYAYKLSKRECSKYIDELKAARTQNLLDGNERLREAVSMLERLESEGRLKGFTQGLLDRYRKWGELSEKQIDCLLKDSATVDRNAAPAELALGVYELDDEVFIVKPTRDKQRTYALKLVEINAERATEAGERVQIEFEYASGAIYKLKPEHKMPLERAKTLTIRYGRCIVCKKKLKAAESVERGIGPVCIKSFA